MSWYNPADWVSSMGDALDRNRNNPYKTVDPGGFLNSQSQQAGAFANQGQAGFGQATQQNQQQIGALQALQDGQNSVSAEQLRQALQQNVAGQMSMANSAQPGNAAMAARTAMMNAGTQGAGLAGQQSVAGLAERNQATMNLSQLLSQNQQAQLQAALQSRANSLQGYNDITSANTQRYGAVMGTPTPGQSLMSGGVGLGSMIAAA